MTTKEYHHSDDHGHSHHHTDEHCCDHHNHEHHHHDGAADPAKTTALLGYMLNHNREHAEEIAGIAHMLRHADKNDAAGLLEEAVKDFNAGNENLKRALDLITGGE